MLAELTHFDVELRVGEVLVTVGEESAKGACQHQLNYNSDKRELHHENKYFCLKGIGVLLISFYP